MIAGVLDSVAGIVTWSIVLILGILAASSVLLRLRRRAVDREDESGEVFTMEAVERMLAEGAITLEEYRTLRRMVMGLPPAQERPADSGSSPPAPDVDAQ